jgi:thymidylate kinase
VSEANGRLYVLLGGDYAGKSRLMAELRERVDWALVSADEGTLAPPYDTLVDMRRLFVERVLPNASQLLTPDYVLSGLQMSLVYLRDRAASERARGDVLVDSYHYKLLAKCRLHGLVSPDIFHFWRSFPRPDRVIYLRISPEVAWQRARAAGRLNRFEHHGESPTRDRFVRFQRDLAAAMRAEVAPVAIDVVDGEQDPATVRVHVEALLGAGREEVHGDERQPLRAAGDRGERAIHPVG